MKLIIHMLTWLLISGVSSLAQDMAELELDHNVNSEFVTPHTAWAKPYVAGKTRVLFFCYGRDVEPREAIELKQRFDIDLQMVFWTWVIDSPRQEWQGGEHGIQRMRRLLAQKWDVFVFMSPLPQLGVQAITPELLPVEEQYTLLKAVTEGAGLVLIGADDPRVLKEKNRLSPTPALLNGGEWGDAAAYRVIKGRAVRLPRRPEITYRRGWEVDYDHWMMHVGKAILWAAGKEPPCQLTVEPTAEQTSRASLPAPCVQLRWEGARHATAQITLRREDGANIIIPPRTLDTPSGRAEVRLPVVRAGRYYLDVIAREGKNVVGFASTSVEIVGQHKVEAVTLDRDWTEIGETLSGKVTLSSPLSAQESLKISLYDRRGREIVRQVHHASTPEIGFRFTVQPWFPMLVEVRATLVDARGEASSTWQFARVVKRHRGRFNFVIWDIPRGYLAPFVEQSLAQTGVTIHLSALNTPPYFYAAYEMAWIPYTTHISAACKPVCWADEEKVQSYVDEIVNKFIPTRQHGVFVYSLGDEIVVRGSCTSDHCLSAYRRYLREQYGDISSLNASWGTNYSSFDEVQLTKADDNNEAEALRSGNFPRWFDRQAFQSYNFCKLCERFGKAFRNMDPQSRCGFEGAGTFGGADDLDGFVRFNTFWTPYPGAADEVLRSVAPRDFPRSNWMGYTKDANTLLEKYWRMITRGCDSVWWWRWEALGQFHGWLSPTLDPFPAVQELLRDTRIVREGLGDLLLTSEMQTDGIGILYSLPSAYAAKVQVSTTYGSYEGNHVAFHNAVRELGLNFRYFTDRQMRLQEVDLSKFKVILLPMTEALSSQEAEMLRAFVRNGGLLIADIRPAIYDGHVKPLTSGQLDDVFGVKRAGFPEAQVADARIHPPTALAGTLPVLELPKVRVDAGITTAGAQAWGEAGNTPVWLVHNFGKGKAVLLNMAMSTFPSLSSPATTEAAAAVWQLLFQGVVTPEVRLTDEKGERLRNVEITRWLNGAVQIVSVFRHHGTSENAELRFTRRFNIYDLKARKHLGSRDRVRIVITPYRAQFFALSPQPLPMPRLKVTPKVARGGLQRIIISAALNTGKQAFRVRVLQPNGEEADWFNPILIADARGTSCELPIAFNDPPGTWNVEATELYTGKTLRTHFRVE